MVYLSMGLRLKTYNGLLLVSVATIIAIPMVYSLILIPLVIESNYSYIMDNCNNTMINLKLNNESNGEYTSKKDSLVLEFNLNQFNITFKTHGSCSEIYNFTVLPLTGKSRSWFDYINYNETAYPYIVYNVPIRVRFEGSNMIQSYSHYCTMFINVSSSVGRFLYCNIMDWSINESRMPSYVTVYLNLKILEVDRYSMREIQSLLFLMMVAFYVYDLGVFIVLDRYEDPMNSLKNSMNLILSDSPVLYTVILPFIAYMISQRPNISVGPKHNIPEFVSFSLVVYLFLHYTITTLLKYTKNSKSQFDHYHVLNLIALAILAISLCTHSTIPLPVKIAELTYAILSLRNLMAMGFSRYVLKTNTEIDMFLSLN